MEEYFLFDSEAGPADRAMWAYRAGWGDYEPMLPAGMVSGKEEYASRVLGLGFRRDGDHVRVRDPVTVSDYLWPEKERQAHRRAIWPRKRAAAAAELRAGVERRKSAEAGQRRAEAETTVLLRRIEELEAKLRAGSV